MSKLITQIREELKSNTDEITRQSSQRYFKEEVRGYGVKTAIVGKIAKKYWKEIEDKDKKTVFSLCEELLKSDYNEEAFIVSYWGTHFHHFTEPDDLPIFRTWIEKYINNWAKCDGFCNHAVGNLIMMFPDKINELKEWTKSRNRWMKRAAAVSLIIPAKKGMFLDEAFEISSLLLRDKDDLVQKGYGWLLKEESRINQQEVFDFVMANKKEMPRTALRYAIELMPKPLKAEAMKK